MTLHAHAWGRHARAVALAFALGWLVAAPAAAQQPSSVNPTASSVNEEQLLRQLKSVDGRITIPDAKAGVLIQPAGRDWRGFRDGTLPWVGGLAILGMLVAVAAFYFWRGRIAIASGPSGRRILRFGGFERFVHWLTAGSFILLALTGVNITFGRALLLPLLGPEIFAAVSQLGKYAHDYVAFPFMVGLAFMLLVWIKDNVPDAIDVAWLKAGGGLVGDAHPPARRFNAGQKLIFWSVIVGGTALSLTGLTLLFPFSLGMAIADMQLWSTVHGLVAVVLIGVMIAHVYIGSLGMEGAFDAMGGGDVDLNWAREHHSLWVDEALARERAAAGAKPSSAPAE